MQQYTYTRLSATYLLTLLQGHFAGLTTATCHYFTAGLHDNYIVTTDSARFICRVYRNDWRAEDEVAYELELLGFLRARGAPVASPVPSISGRLFFLVDCPEGIRLAALFNYAEGIAPGADLNTETALLLGQSVAMSHQASVGFQSDYQRKALNLSFLLTESLHVILPFLQRDEDANFLRQVAQELENKLRPIESDLPQVLCHGDVNPGNFHVTADQRITLFDFDQCGIGARVFEIAKFQAAIHRF
ncbi:MAG: phosphotransferase enzyme family protein, partial [Thiolinea sp.]